MTVSAVLDPLAAAAPLAEQVADALRAAIFSGRLSPGERLSVPDVARQLGVSRTPAREAMLILERDGLIATRPRLGAAVVSYGDAELAEMLDLREALDGMAARLAAERMTTGEKRALEKLLDNHNEALAVSDVDRHIELDLEFHRHLRDGAHNRRLHRALLDLERQCHVLMNSTSKAPGFAGRAVMHDHRAIVQAILTGDADGAEHAARAHVRRIRHFCAQLADRYGAAPQAHA
jgi:DNA-binding GntR family transcriptional regulator